MRQMVLTAAFVAVAAYLAPAWSNKRMQAC